MVVSTGNISTPKKQWYSNNEVFYSCTDFISGRPSVTDLKHLYICHRSALGVNLSQVCSPVPLAGE